MHHPTDRITHTTTFVTPVVEHWLEREIAQWVHPMKDRSDDPSHQERTLLPRSYISLPSNINANRKEIYKYAYLLYFHHQRARCSSMVEHPLMMRWVVGSILHGGPFELFLVPASVPRLVDKDRGKRYPVCGIVHIKEPLLPIGKSSGFPLSLNGPLPYI